MAVTIAPQFQTPRNNRHAQARNEQTEGGRPQREQKFPPSTHLYHQGRLCTFYVSWQGRTNLIVVPHQRVYKMTEFYPLDLSYIFQEIQTVVEQKNVRNYTTHIYKRDWEVSPHLFFKVGMPQQAYENFAGGPLSTQGVAQMTPPIPAMPVGAARPPSSAPFSTPPTPINLPEVLPTGDFDDDED
jgi:hypothetical protein